MHVGGQTSLLVKHGVWGNTHTFQSTHQERCVQQLYIRSNFWTAFTTNMCWNSCQCMWVARQVFYEDMSSGAIHIHSNQHIWNAVCSNCLYLKTLNLKTLINIAHPDQNELKLKSLAWFEEYFTPMVFFALVLEEVQSPASLWTTIQKQQGGKCMWSISTHFSAFRGFPIVFLVSICSSPPGEGLESSSYIF